MQIVDNLSNCCSINNEIEAIDKLKLLDTDKIIYEVIRIINGVPLFLEEHYLRLQQSFALEGVKLSLELHELKEGIKRLIVVEQRENCNVKVAVTLKNEVQTLIIYLSKFHYPSSEEYSKGVTLSLMQLERETPNVKKLNFNYNEIILKKINENKVFEILLANRDNKMLEGSKSNVFFVQGQSVVTAPNEYILEGITRRYVVKICKDLGINLIQECVSVDALRNIDGVFITGTSIKILPAAQIDSYSFLSSTNPIIAAIQKKYETMIEEYIARNI